MLSANVATPMTCPASLSPSRSDVWHQGSADKESAAVRVPGTSPGAVTAHHRLCQPGKRSTPRGRFPDTTNTAVFRDRAGA